MYNFGITKLKYTDKVNQKNQNTAKKKKKKKKKKTKIGYTITKWRPKNQFPSRDIKFPTKNGKTTFPKKFFLEIWLIIEDCKYNYTAEMKVEKKKKKKKNVSCQNGLEKVHF